MAEIHNLQELDTLKTLCDRVLKEEDKVYFHIKDKTFCYEVYFSHLGLSSQKNDTIFEILELDKFKISRECYGYGENSSGLCDDFWPQVKDNDFKALTKLVIKLYETIEEKEEKKQKNEQKVFRDLLGREIKVGDNVLHLWTKVDSLGYAKGGEGAINKKIATVIKQTKKGIGIEWRDKYGKKVIKKSTIFNTRNRLIILDGISLKLHYEDIVKNVGESYEAYKKGATTKYKNLNEKMELSKEKVLKMEKENEELKEAIRSLTIGSDRFRMIDLE